MALTFLSTPRASEAISEEHYETWGAYRFFKRGVIAWFRDGNEAKIYRRVQS